MRLRPFPLSLAAALAWLIPSVVQAQTPAGAVPIQEQLPGLHLLQGPWMGGTIHRESVLFLKSEGGGVSAKLLYDAEKVLEVRTADGRYKGELKRDFDVFGDGSGLLLVEGSKLPFIDEKELFRPKGSPKSIGHRAGHPDTSLLFDNVHYFHDMQVEVTYVPRNPRWDSYRPTFAGDKLKRTIGKLKNKQPVTIAVSGDSISEGYNASAFTKTTPFMPPYPGLVAAQLEATFGSKVTMHNLAVGGWSTRQGVNDLDRLIKTKPDLVIIAYGMNDVSRRDAKTYRANIETMLKRIKEADAETEVILIATMTGNKDWYATSPGEFPIYRDALATLQGPGITMLDMTSIWDRLLKRKRHVDLTGNGVNHPNDHGHRVYAQAILALLIEKP